MFVGHYAPAYFLRTYYKVPLWKLFLAVQAAGRGREILREIAEGMGPEYEAFRRKAEEMSLEQVVERALEG